MKDNFKSKIIDFSKNNKSLNNVRDKANIASSGAKKYQQLFLASKAGKAFQIVTGSAVTRVVGIATAALTIAGVTSVLAPPVAIAVGTLALAAVAVGAGVSVYQTRTMRRLRTEQNSLIKHRIAKSEQLSLLRDNPKLANILQNDLISPPLQETKVKKYIKEKTKQRLIPKTIAKTALANSFDIASSLLNGIATGGVSIATNIGLTTFNFITNSKFEVDMAKAGLKLKEAIDVERDKKDTPGYTMLRELKNETTRQIVQTEALKQLINDQNYPKMDKEQLKTRFNELKLELGSNEKVHSLERTFSEKALRVGEEIAKDFVRTHNPFSKYNNPDKLKGLELPKEKSQPIQVTFEEQTLKQSIKPIKDIISLNQQSEKIKKNIIRKQSTRQSNQRQF